LSTRPTALEAPAGNPARSALVLDFDGVLSPIVDDPRASVLPDRTAELLTRLADHLGMLTVISGRPLDFWLSASAFPVFAWPEPTALNSNGKTERR
jgi:trehalose 6-phosphate phosphatase